MAVFYRNPMSVIRVEDSGGTDSGITIDNYNENTKEITGKNFGTSLGKVLLLNRDTHSYVEQPVDSWDDKIITLTNAIDTSTIEGTTCFVIQTAEGSKSHQYLINGDIAITSWGKLYVKNGDDSISKLNMTSATDLNVLVGTSASYGTTVTIDSKTFSTGQIVGIQFGSGMSSWNMPSYFLAGFTGLNQPVVFNSKVTLAGTSTYFMFNCRGFDSLVVFRTSTNNRIPGYFMNNCYAFNQPVDWTNVKYMNSNYIMRYCYAFNQKITFPTTLNTSYRTFGTYFMYYCENFNQEITLPTNLTSVGNYFMNYCTKFNKPLKLPASHNTAVTYFMRYCRAFNQTMDLSGTTMTSIGTNFLADCRSFNSPVKFRTSAMTIGTYFLYNDTAFNQPLDFSKITSIGNYCLGSCTAFNSPITFSSSSFSIGSQFMYGCFSFNQVITIPSVVSSIGASFMGNCYQTRKMIVESSAVPPSSGMTMDIADCPAYQTGVYFYGSKRADWITALPDQDTSPFRKSVNGGS